MHASLLDGVRAAAREVAEAATFVRLDLAALPAYAASLPLERLRAPALDPATHYLGHGAATLAYLVTLDAVNFGSGYFPHLAKRPGRSGYFTVALSLKEAFEARGRPFDAAELQAMDAAACARLFGQPPQAEAPAPAWELMGLFAQALRDLGGLLTERYGGDPARLVAAAEGSAERLVGLLAAMPLYRDVARYRGRDVPFYKRAQLTASDLAVAGVAAFQDLDRLTLFADNLVPHVLRLDGVLRCDAGLVARIERGEVIPSGSAEEVELRAGAVDAVERMVAELRRRGERVNAAQVDMLLWKRGQEAAYKAHPRPRARSTFY